MSEERRAVRGLGLPARAAATAAAMAGQLVVRAAQAQGLVAAGKLSPAEAGALAGAVASACRAALSAGSSAPQRERFGALSGGQLLVRLSPELSAFVSSEATRAGVSAPCWLRWAASEQQRLALAPLEPGEQEKLAGGGPKNGKM